VADQEDVVTALKAIVMAALFPPTATISGTVTANDVIDLTLTPTPPNADTGKGISCSYTVQPGDTLSTIAAGLSKAFNNAAGLLARQSASPTGAVIQFSLPGLPWTFAATLSVGATEVVTFGAAPGNAMVMAGWPLPSDLDKMVTAYNGGEVSTTTKPIVSIYPRPNSTRKTSRYFSKWQELSRPSKTVTLTVDGNQVSVGGAAPGGSGAVQNLVLVVEFGSGTQAFNYQTASGDSLATIATNLAAVVNAVTPASASGEVITVTDAASIVARVGVIGTVVREKRRQSEVFDIHVWVPSPGFRKTVGAPIRDAFSDIDQLTLVDGFAARVRCCGDEWLDDPDKAGIWRRCIAFDVDYPTTETAAAAEILTFGTQIAAGQIVPTDPNVSAQI